MEVTCPNCNKTRNIHIRWGLADRANCASCAQYLSSKRNEICGYKNGLKKCTVCKEWQQIEQFTKNRTHWDNLEAYCKSCNTIKMRDYRERNKERCNRMVYASMAKYPERTYARKLAGIRFPQRQQCSVGNCQELGERHHDDYAKPYDIRWLCRKHHHGTA